MAIEGEPVERWVDRERFLGVARDCDWTATELAIFYCDGAAKELERIRAALEAGGDREFARLVHGSVGSASTCGMAGIVELLRPLEEAAWAARLDGAHEVLERAASRLAKIRQALTADGGPSLAGSTSPSR